MQPIRGELVKLSWSIHALAALLLMAGVAIYLGWFYGPLQARAHRAQSQADQLKTLLRESDIVLARHGEVERELQELVAATTEMRRRIPAAPAVGDYLTSIGEIAAEEELYIQDYRQIAEVQHPVHSQIDLALKCEGGYRQLCRFMERLEKLPRVSRLSQLTLRSVPNEDRYAIEIRLVLYHGLQPAPPVEAATSAGGTS